MTIEKMNEVGIRYSKILDPCAQIFLEGKQIVCKCGNRQFVKYFCEFYFNGRKSTDVFECPDCGNLFEAQK